MKFSAKLLQPGDVGKLMTCYSPKMTRKIGFVVKMRYFWDEKQRFYHSSHLLEDNIFRLYEE